MEIQSLSVCVPAKCPNKCKFCVSQTHTNNYQRRLFSDDPFAHRDFIERLEYARDNGVHCLIFTGTGEPLLNMPFLNYFDGVNKSLTRSFHHLEIQTSGVTLDNEKLRDLRYIGVKTISLSLSSFISEVNSSYNGIPKNIQFDVNELCEKIKQNGFNLRLSLNMTDSFGNLFPSDIFIVAKSLGANQITFRVLYTSGKGYEQDNWINEHRATEEKIKQLNDFIVTNGTQLNKLSFGAMKYDIQGMSVVLDDDCMHTKVRDSLKYLILREDCRIYSHWDKTGSLIF